jgi:hypothetical protein
MAGSFRTLMAILEFLHHHPEFIAFVPNIAFFWG